MKNYGTGKLSVVSKARWSLCSTNPSGTFSPVHGGRDAPVSSPILELSLQEGLWGDGAHQHIGAFFEALELHQPSQLHLLLGNDGDRKRATKV